MVYEDVPHPTKHFTFGRLTDGLSDIVSGFPGIKVIVLHTHGKKGEHPHYHIWWEGDAVTNQTIKNRLKKYNPLFSTYNTQMHWSMRNHESFENWASYVQRNQTAKILYVADGVTMPAPPLRDTIELIAPTPVTPAIPAPAPRIKKMTEKERLINYFIVEEGFKQNRYTLIHFEPGSVHIARIKKEIRNGICAYATGRLSNSQMEYMGRHVMYYFADEDLREAFAEDWAQAVEKKWWSRV